MTEVSSLPSVQKEPQLEDILESLLGEGKMAANQSQLDRLCATPSTELFLDSLLTHSLYTPPASTYEDHSVFCSGGPQNSPPQQSSLLGNDGLGMSPSHSDGYVTGQPSPLSDSSVSEVGSSSTLGYSPVSLYGEVERKVGGPPSRVPQSSSSSSSSASVMVSTLGEPSPTLPASPPHQHQHQHPGGLGLGLGLNSFPEDEEQDLEGLSLPLHQQQQQQQHGCLSDLDLDLDLDMDLDLLEMGASPQPPPESPVDLTSWPAERKASSLRVNAKERALLEADGIFLPEDMPLTKAEEKNLRKVRRKLKNRLSAHESRVRKKEYMDGLEDRVSRCTNNNRHLQRKVSTLEQHNRSLVSQLRRLQRAVRAYNPSLLQGGCVMVMVLSFSLFFIPKFIPNGMGTGLGDTVLATGAVAMGARSRALLETEDALLPSKEDDLLSNPGDTPPLHLHHAFLNQEEGVASQEQQEEGLTSQEHQEEAVASQEPPKLSNIKSHSGHNSEDL